MLLELRAWNAAGSGAIPRRRGVRGLALALALIAAASFGHARAAPGGEPIRASYFYAYMDPEHLDALAAAGLNRAVIKYLGDSLDRRAAEELGSFIARGSRLGVEVVPDWSLHSRARLAALSSGRRYTWGEGTVEQDVGCPLDPAFWRGALRDRARELLRVFPGLTRLAVDLEIYTGSRRHYDEPCRCANCRLTFVARDPHEPQDLEPFQERRLEAILVGLLREFHAAHPRVEVGFFDLDYDAFVHRAMVRALVRARLPTANYTERTYSRGDRGIPAARAALDSLGLAAPLICGLKLRSFTPRELSAAVRGVLAQADGYFLFSSYSLWHPDPASLADEYALAGEQEAYWSALAKMNGGGARARLVSVSPDPRGSDAGGAVRSGPIATVSPAFPNPSPRGTHLDLTLFRAAQVTWGVWDLQGRSAWRETLELGAGATRLTWPGLDRAGKPLPGGVYFVRVESEEQRVECRLVLLGR